MLISLVCGSFLSSVSTSESTDHVPMSHARTMMCEARSKERWFVLPGCAPTLQPCTPPCSLENVYATLQPCTLPCNLARYTKDSLFVLPEMRTPSVLAHARDAWTGGATLGLPGTCPGPRFQAFAPNGMCQQNVREMRIACRVALIMISFCRYYFGNPNHK